MKKKSGVSSTAEPRARLRDDLGSTPGLPPNLNKIVRDISNWNGDALYSWDEENWGEPGKLLTRKECREMFHYSIMAFIAQTGGRSK